MAYEIGENIQKEDRWTGEHIGNQLGYMLVSMIL